MKLLLDTQCWLWWFAQPEKLNEYVIEQNSFAQSPSKIFDLDGVSETSK
ncbi:MAG: hypothetical protein QNJ33_15950 [Crocosphaera sp.]|nr:hypothetical protein [Crocosphaera sp.]